MAGDVAIDTSAVIAQLRQDPALEAQLSTFDRLFLPITVVGELRYGAEHSSDPQNGHRTIDELLPFFGILYTNDDTAAYYGRIKSSLHRKGRPIPDNDLWIAACALQNGLPLLARDEHFADVDGLQLESW